MNQLFEFITFFSNPKSVEAKEHKDIGDQRENDVSAIRKENEHLKSKIDKMADAAKEYENQLKVQNENKDYRSSIEYEMKLLKVVLTFIFHL